MQLCLWWILHGRFWNVQLAQAAPLHWLPPTVAPEVQLKWGCFVVGGCCEACSRASVVSGQIVKGDVCGCFLIHEGYFPPSLSLSFPFPCVFFCCGCHDAQAAYLYSESRWELVESGESRDSQQDRASPDFNPLTGGGPPLTASHLWNSSPRLSSAEHTRKAFEQTSVIFLSLFLCFPT